jgi:hypothetical protein
LGGVDVCPVPADEEDRADSQEPVLEAG